MSPKLSKNLTHFEQVCREIDHVKKKIEDCESCEHARVTVLKSKVKGLEQKLENSFQNLSLNDNEDSFDIFMSYQDILTDLSVDLESKTEKIVEEVDNSESKKVHSESKSNAVRLPIIEIPLFFGENWISFKELFSSTILKNESLSNVEKLQYLQSSVRGNAAKLIRGFALQSENLEHCWNILKNRYENKRLLAVSQINKVFLHKVNKVDSPKGLLELIDVCNEAIRNLDTLGLESNSLSDLIFINFMLAKCDSSVKQNWERSLEGDSIPDLKTFRSFIEREARAMQDLKSETKHAFVKKPNQPTFGERKMIVNNSISVKEVKCILCSQNHQLFKCCNFNRMNVNERWNFVKENKLCPNCLRSNHLLDKCRINIFCKNCAKKHHTLLHKYTEDNANISREIHQESVSNNSQCQSPVHNDVLLSTALIKVKSPKGQVIRCRALIDNASQNSLISKQCAERLDLALIGSKHQLIGINGMSAETSLHVAEFKISPHFSNDFSTVRALVVNRVTTPLPNFRLDRESWPHTENLLLADPEFHKKGPVDLLIGADIFASIIQGPAIQGERGEPAAIPTTLGHILSGPIDKTYKNPENYSLCNLSLNEQIERFWALESVPQHHPIPDIEDPAEIIYRETVKRNEDGRYVVKLPVKPDCELGNSANHASKLFLILEQKLNKNKQLKESYSEFMDEYQQLAHMQALTEEEKRFEPNFYLPHHAVINDNSSTTKVRVVFNASAKSTNNKSLNSILFTGPKLQTSIFSNLIQFRSYQIALSADLEKMYRQILVTEEDTHLQRIFWRNNVADPLKEFKLNTVTYGTSCAPFLALRTLQQLCHDEKDNFPHAANIAKTHFYVDDFLGGADSIEDAKTLISDLRNLFFAGGFNLRKWCSNNNEAIDFLPESQKGSPITHNFQPDSAHRILGLEWNLNTDVLQVRVSKDTRVATKRQLLSTIARIFDPLGLLAPSTIVLKILMQEVWKLNLKWDEKLPSDILDTWSKFDSQIMHFQEMQISRCLYIDQSSLVELHGFCDASPKAYSAVCYLRVFSSDIKVSIVAAKTRVAPLQSVTLPRLELSAALLLAELVTIVQPALRGKIDTTVLWTDSTITLSWIKNPPTNENPFVQHRVQKILNLTTKEQWFHTPGVANPADLATRGIFPEQLKSNQMWWQGPAWLTENRDSPCSAFATILQNPSAQSPEEEQPYNPKIEIKSDILRKFSSYTKLLRVVAWIFRFVNNTRTSKTRGPLKAIELRASIETIVKLIQKTEFAEEIEALRNHKSVNKKSKILSLQPFLDQKDILRVGGRLSQHPSLAFHKKYPMLLPKKHPVTEAVIRHFHESSLHAGPELVLSLIRQQFWIPDGRSAVKKELRTCVRCFKLVAKPIRQVMGNLPSSRITPCRPFEKVGVDFAGPIATKCQHKRKSTQFKSYMCLFICMCSKAVHLELVSDLSTNAFLLTLRRFIARRGIPTDIWSDNGKNFVGAAAYLKSLVRITQDAEIQDFCSSRQISWHFNPPYAPNFGGLWEASIKLMKRHLSKSLNGAILNFEEMATVLCQIEACINSRPLWALSTDPNDLSALTPGHFLIGVPLLELPEPANNNCCLSSHSRWQLLQTMKTSFWRQWSRSYLQNLLSRKKWTTGTQLLQPGQLVLLDQADSPACHWKLARILEVHPGEDGVVRVATLQTSHGKIRRSVSRLAVLPGPLAPAEDGRNPSAAESQAPIRLPGPSLVVRRSCDQNPNG